VTADTLDLSGYGFAVCAMVIAGVLVVAILVVRSIAHDREVRLSRIGVFVERERFDQDHEPEEPE
jgi:hypothetical protein